MQFCFYPVVLGNIKLKCMQRALCLLRFCQIFMRISDMSQITHHSIVNCLDSYENGNRRLYKSTSEYSMLLCVMLLHTLYWESL